MGVTNKHHFRIVFPGNWPTGYWAECKVPETSIKVTKYWPAGSKFEKKQPSGLTETDNIELKYFDDSDGLMDAKINEWVKDCKGRKKPDECKINGTIEQVETDGTVVHAVNCKGMFVVKALGFEGKSGDEAAVEKSLVISVDEVDWVR